MVMASSCYEYCSSLCIKRQDDMMISEKEVKNIQRLADSLSGCTKIEEDCVLITFHGAEQPIMLKDEVDDLIGPDYLADWWRPSPEPSCSKQLCLRRVPTPLSPQDLRNEFSKYGTVTEISMALGNKIAFITFKELREAVQAKLHTEHKYAILYGQAQKDTGSHQELKRSASSNDCDARKRSKSGPGSIETSTTTTTATSVNSNSTTVNSIHTQTTYSALSHSDGAIPTSAAVPLSSAEAAKRGLSVSSHSPRASAIDLTQDDDNTLQPTTSKPGSESTQANPSTLPFSLSQQAAALSTSRPAPIETKRFAGRALSHSSSAVAHSNMSADAKRSIVNSHSNPESIGTQTINLLLAQELHKSQLLISQLHQDTEKTKMLEHYKKESRSYKQENEKISVALRNKTDMYNNVTAENQLLKEKFTLQCSEINGWKGISTKLREELAMQKQITEQCSREFEKALQQSQKKTSENAELVSVRDCLTAKVVSLNEEITKLKQELAMMHGIGK